MKTFLKEPLLHFLLLGAALFYFYALVNDNQANDNEISISAAKIVQLKYSFEKTRQRQPSEEELAALVNNYLKEQVAYQKGVEMGLLAGDGIIQKRIQQKVEFIVEDSVSRLEPDDAELSGFLKAHPDDYRSEQFFSFVQLYFDPSKHRNVTAVLTKTLAQITALDETEHTAVKLMPLSDNIFLDYQYTDVSYAFVARYFGSKFADSLVKLSMNTWQQKIQSGYGVHLVQLTQRTGGEIQSLDKVREQVKQDWLNEQRKLSLAKFYQQLFAEYNINVS
ncbi:peptidyl-prolyl cis-trans isomerase [Colwellia psychrerythraea]|uniref:PpiC-type peptidyl-prolyl cis-trans isomerase n=1 Tax=Colwellia psychrerythraea TaxID=28229 RepID=A0A099K9D2_COLPS|nr:peptidylprolyl isomerase [Colwellia psychrerythraea]KGJ87354.1 PpiC-type peptidyl-prolyl cis-trans isomerase [Colwellia psychrerythraea]